MQSMIARAFPLPSPLSSPQPISYDSSRRRRRFPEATASAPAGEPRAPASRKRANLVALRKEKVKLPEYTDVHGRALSIAEFLNHPSGVKSLLNTRALQSFESLGPNTYRCTLHKIRFLAFEVAPVLELRVIPTIEACTVEMLACKFEGSESVEKQNDLFSAFMRNHITWVVDCSDPCLEVDVNLSVFLEVYTKPFSLLPISAVEKPGNLVMQGLVDRLVPLLAEQLLKDYATWVEQQLQFFG